MYLAAKRPNAVGPEGAPLSIFDALDGACGENLKQEVFRSLEELFGAQRPCRTALSWMYCRQEPEKPEHLTCPSEERKEEWRARFHRIYELRRAFNGDAPYFWVGGAPATLEATPEKAEELVKQGFERYLADANPELTFDVASQLLSNGVSEYRGTDLVRFVTRYAFVPNYERSIGAIVGATQTLFGQKRIDGRALADIYYSLLDDRRLSMGDYLYVEEVSYGAGLLR
jgi:hypothetical protein